MVTVVGLRKLPVPSGVLESYWYFAAERQEIFFRRLVGEKGPWTKDPILREHKFTNVYRACDRVSQYLIRNVIYREDLPDSAEEVFFRVLLFKLFNKIETWQLLERKLGEVSWRRFDFGRLDMVLSAAMAAGVRIYSAAYIMPPGGAAVAERVKHRNHLRLLESMMRDGLPAKMAACRRMADGFALLRGYPMIGDFLAYQLVTDINYTTLTDFSEMEFVMPGPGARSGIRKCFSDLGGYDEAGVIRLMAETQGEQFASRGLGFRDLFGRPLQLIDCQGLFCETDKYARVAHPQVQGRMGRMRIKQKFSPQAEAIRYFFPPKWGMGVKHPL